MRVRIAALKLAQFKQQPIQPDSKNNMTGKAYKALLPLPAEDEPITN